MSNGPQSLRAHASLSFEIARALSDQQAAEDLRHEARQYLRRADDLEARERLFEERNPIIPSTRL
jgi:hypothetical protein